MQDELSTNPIDEASLAEQPVQHGPHWVFYGKDGLRAGWSALLFVFILVALGATKMKTNSRALQLARKPSLP